MATHYGQRPPLNNFPEAAAAYSLRPLHREAISDPVVRVRRSVDNAERDFTTIEVNNGTLEDWVNTTLGNPAPAPADFGTGATAAYSLRYVSDSYSGPVVRVRESGGNTEQDFTPDQIEDGTLETFCGSNNGLVTTWYDQSGNGNHATQTTASSQPKIVNAGTLVTENGRAALDFDGSGQQLIINSSLATTFSGEDVPLSSFTLIRNKNISQIENIFTLGDASSEIIRPIYFSPGTPEGSYRVFNRDNSGNSIGFSFGEVKNQYLLLSTTSNGTQQNAFENTNQILNNQNINLGNMTFSGSTIGGRIDILGNLNANIGELIIYNSDQSANRASIETDINSYYSVYTTYDGFVTTWYDQSGNDNHATQTTAANQPKIVSAGLLVKENGRAALDFDSVNDYFTTSVTLSSGIFSLFVPHKLKTNGSYAYISSSTGGTTAERVITRNVNTGAYEIDNPNTISGGNQSLDTVLLSVFGRATDKIYLNGLEIASGNSGSNSFSNIDLFGRKTSNQFFFNGFCPELILYPSDQSANRTSIETNINNYYGIY